MSSRTNPRLAVLVPVYNHFLTVGGVISGAAAFYPVLAVDDGSTDATPGVLAASPAAAVVTLPKNAGKGAALRRGFELAREMGFTHAITIDADGQHPVGAIPAFAQASRENPGALVIGVRDLRADRAPLVRRVSNWLSALLFRLETGIPLPDSQCGMRVYPLALVRSLPVTASRYAYELEVMARAAWARIPINPCPVHADYQARTSRLSHFHPLWDFGQACGVHGRLLVEALFVRRSRPS